MSYDRHVCRLWQTPIRDYWRTMVHVIDDRFLRAGSPRNRRNRLNCDVYGPSRKIDARPMAPLEAFVASFLSPSSNRGFDKCESKSWKKRWVKFRKRSGENFLIGKFDGLVKMINSFPVTFLTDAWEKILEDER